MEKPLETAERANTGFGDRTKLYQQRAVNALPFLVRQAKANQTIFYSDLASELSMPNPRNLNYPLGAIGAKMEALAKVFGKKVPPIQCLVINKHEGIPGEGIGWFVGDPNQFRKLPSIEKERIVGKMLSEIFSFKEWDSVLEHYGMDPIQVSSTSSLLGEAKEASRRFGSGGEDEPHRRLKEYVAQTPELFGLSGELAGEIEHLFPSVDSLDVLFKNGNAWVGVEVKGPVSDDLDINRGLFQCVKYRALMEAEQRVLQCGIDCRQVLVVSRHLSPELEQKRLVLNIEVVVVPPSDYSSL